MDNGRRYRRAFVQITVLRVRFGRNGLRAYGDNVDLCARDTRKRMMRRNIIDVQDGTTLRREKCATIREFIIYIFPDRFRALDVVQ